MKNKIQSRFNAASDSYDQVAHVQKNSAEILVTKLRAFAPDFIPKIILDLGAGTGYAVEELLKYYPQAQYVLNDIAPEMIKIVQNKFKQDNQFNFDVSDMETSEFQNHDLIISNLALQWVSDLEKTLAKFTAKSKVFAFSCLLDGTFREWEEILGIYKINKYPTKEKLIHLLESFGKEYIFETIDCQLTFPNARSFMIYLQNLGASASNFQIPKQVIKNLLKNYKQEFTVTYKIFFGIIGEK